MRQQDLGVSQHCTGLDQSMPVSAEGSSVRVLKSSVSGRPDTGPFLKQDFLGGPSFIYPQPPTPENTLPGVGGRIREGGGV